MLVQCVIAIFLFVHIRFIIKVAFKLLEYGSCSFVIREKGVYHKQILRLPLQRLLKWWYDLPEPDMVV
jgi:hypothetical protein